jgi:hypothetical protein
LRNRVSGSFGSGVFGCEKARRAANVSSSTVLETGQGV